MPRDVTDAETSPVSFKHNEIRPDPVVAYQVKLVSKKLNDSKNREFNRKETKLIDNIAKSAILKDRLNTRFLKENILDNKREYEYQSWNHLKKSGMTNIESEILLKIGEDRMVYFNSEENHYRKLFDGLPQTHLKRGVSLAYLYHPENCFNSMIDVITMKERLKPLDAKKTIEIETIRQKYKPRILEKVKDSLYKPTEFPHEGKSATNRSRLKTASRYRKLKEDVKNYTSYMKKKDCFLLKQGRPSEDMLECLEPSEEYFRLTKKDSDESSGDEKAPSSRGAAHNPTINHQNPHHPDHDHHSPHHPDHDHHSPHHPDHDHHSPHHPEHHSPHHPEHHSPHHLHEGDHNHHQSPAHPRKSIDRAVVLHQNSRIGHHRNGHKQISLSSVSNSFVDDFVEVDASLYIAKKKDVEKGYLEPEDFYSGLIEREKELNSLEVLNWSGEQIYSLTGYGKSKTLKAIESLNRQNLDIWLQGFRGIIKVLRRKAGIFIFNPLSSSIIFFFVMFYILILLLSNLVSDTADNGLRQLSNFFTFVFVIEILAKIFALGPRTFARSIVNLIDFAAVVINLIDLFIIYAHPEFTLERHGIFDGTMVLRMFIVFRIVRYLKNLKFMKVILEVTKAAAGQYLLVAVILVILMFVFILFGVQTYHGKLKYSNMIPRYNFEGMLGGFITLLQLLTMKNWLDILQVYIQANVNQVLTLIFILAWIIIGNYIIFNLFLATLLGGFESPEVHKTLEENRDEFKELQEVLKKAHNDKLETKEKLEKAKEVEEYAIGYIMNSKADKLKSQNLEEHLVEQNPEIQKKRGTYVLQREMLSESESEDEYLVFRMLDRKVEPVTAHPPGKYDMYKRIHCNASLYIFRKENLFRMICTKIVTNKW